MVDPGIAAPASTGALSQARSAGACNGLRALLICSAASSCDCSGSVSLAGGASLTTRSSLIGDAYIGSFGILIGRGTGSALLEGAGSVWQTGTLTVGGRGSGSFSAGSGSRLAAQSVVLGLNPDAQGVLAASGTGTRIDITDGMQVGFGGTATVTLAGGAALTTGATRIGDVANGNGTVRVEGAGTTWTSRQPLVVGRYAQGGFAVMAGAVADIGTLAIGQQSNGVRGSGSVMLTGGGCRLSAPGAITVGDGGFGSLTVESGRVVESGALTQAGAFGRIVIANGGTLRSASLGLGDPARLDWRSGMLHITGPTGVALDGLQLPSFVDLAAGRTLQVDRTLNVSFDSTLLLSGGTLVAGRLQFDRGVLVSTAGGANALQMGGVGTLVAQGQVGARIVGGSLRNTIIASGALTLGLLSHSDGFAFGGQLDLGNQQVVLLDRDLAGLGAETLLRDGAQLVTVNGAWLDPGARLRSVGCCAHRRQRLRCRQPRPVAPGHRRHAEHHGDARTRCPGAVAGGPWHAGRCAAPPAQVAALKAAHKRRAGTMPVC